MSCRALALDVHTGRDDWLIDLVTSPAVLQESATLCDA